MTVLIHTQREIAAQCAGEVAVVMTMGALHEGHAELIRRSRERVGASGTVIVTVFVNPTQFIAGEDFETYPRTLAGDVEIATQAGATMVYAPSADDVYGTSDTKSLAGRVMISPGPLGGILEGASRPGHFQGVLTVVGTLLHLTGASIAAFGEKDYQQLVLITRMVEQLRFPIEMLPVETAREADGLARSSRNRYLSAQERQIAAQVPIAMHAAVDAARFGEAAAVSAGLDVLSKHPSVEIDYLVVMANDLDVAPATGPARILIAVRVGQTRLIDNLPCTLGPVA